MNDKVYGMKQKQCQEVYSNTNYGKKQQKVANKQGNLTPKGRRKEQMNKKRTKPV